MATEVQMGIMGEGFPAVVIEDREDAQAFVQILARNGVAVNLREVGSGD